jgi:hypothetical protein
MAPVIRGAAETDWGMDDFRGEKEYYREDPAS